MVFHGAGHMHVVESGSHSGCLAVLIRTSRLESKVSGIEVEYLFLVLELVPMGGTV